MFHFIMGLVGRVEGGGAPDNGEKRRERVERRGCFKEMIGKRREFLKSSGRTGTAWTSENRQTWIACSQKVILTRKSANVVFCSDK